MNEILTPTNMVVFGGFILAFIFGAIANKSNFCTMGAISDVVNMEHWGRMRMWLLTMAVAIAGANALFYFGVIDLSKTIYQRSTLPWLSLIVGGLTFGIGMTLAGGCANKNLVRVGGGNLRSLVVLVFVAISAYMTLRGLFGQWRTNFLDPVSVDFASFGLKDQGLSSVIGKVLGLDAKTALALTSSVIVAALFIFIFKDKRFRANGSHIFAGILIGLLAVAAWYLTGYVGFGENPETLEVGYSGTGSRTLESFSFVGPIASTLEMLLLWTDKSLKVNFGIASAIGVALGSWAYAISTGKFRWKNEGFASFDDLRSQLLGAVLMGFGGVTAMGCTVGQGISGISTLAIGSFIAVTGIVVGAALTMKWQQR